MPTPQTGTGPGWDTPLPPGGYSTTAPGAPKGEAGTLATLQAEYDKVQGSLQEIQARAAQRAQESGDPQDATPTTAEAGLIKSYTDRLTALATRIATEQARAPTVIAGGSPNDKFIIRQIPGQEALDVVPNPGWDQKSEKPQTVTLGNRIFNVGTDGSVNVAYTDTDAQALAARQTAVAEGNARVAAAAQATTDFATRARVDMEQKVANGEDAASVRADQAQQLAQMHQEWVQADGDARRQQEALRDYETNRHTTAAEQLSRDQLAATQQAQALQDATSRRGQDIGSATAQMQNTTALRGQDLGQTQAEMSARQAALATRASLANARLSAGQGFLGNALSTMSQLNRDAPPGSEAVGAMLGPLMNVGQDFFGRLGGLDNPEALAQLSAAGPLPSSTSAALPGSITPEQALATNQAAGQASLTPAPQPAISPAVPQATPDAAAEFERQVAEQRARLLAGLVGNPLRSWSQSMPGFGTAGLPSFQGGGVVPGAPGEPTPILAHGGETVLPTSGPSGAGAPAIAAFLQSLATLLQGAGGDGVVSPPAPMGMPSASGAPDQMLAGQAAAVTGQPPAAGANPNLPGLAVPGVPPQLAGSQARTAPLAPDGSPYVTPQYVAQKLAERRGTAQPAAPAGAPAHGPMGV